jgi:hypothetical protein
MSTTFRTHCSTIISFRPIFEFSAKTNWIKLEGGEWKGRGRNERAEGVREEEEEEEEGNQMGMRGEGEEGRKSRLEGSRKQKLGPLVSFADILANIKTKKHKGNREGKVNMEWIDGIILTLQSQTIRCQ